MWAGVGHECGLRNGSSGVRLVCGTRAAVEEWCCVGKAVITEDRGWRWRIEFLLGRLGGVQWPVKRSGCRRLVEEEFGP